MAYRIFPGSEATRRFSPAVPGHVGLSRPGDLAHYEPRRPARHTSISVPTAARLT